MDARPKHVTLVVCLKGAELLSTDCPALGFSDVDTSDNVLLASLAEQVEQVQGCWRFFDDCMHSVDTSNLEVFKQLVVEPFGIDELLEGMGLSE